MTSSNIPELGGGRKAAEGKGNTAKIAGTWRCRKDEGGCGRDLDHSLFYDIRIDKVCRECQDKWGDYYDSPRVEAMGIHSGRSHVTWFYEKATDAMRAETSRTQLRAMWLAGGGKLFNPTETEKAHAAFFLDKFAFLRWARAHIVDVI